MPTVHTIAGEPVLEGKYHIECRLGQGGMGVVYKARHAYLKTQLAIKVILPDLVGNDPQLVTRFRQEALAAAAIRHQNVVSVTDYGVIEGTVPFLVMEYVEGESLHDLLAREKKLSPERALELMSAICAGVGAAHQQGIVHRDLKPLNIMICSGKPNMSQAVKILDFGLAKIKSGELLGSFVQAQTTGLMGSPYYMAPEQWADEEPDSRSDVYSLGVMLYQMLAGDVPFKAASIPAIMKKHISDPPPSLTAAGVAASTELERTVLHALQKDKTRRTPSVEALATEFRTALFPDVQVTNTTSGRIMAVSSLKITTKPPRSSIYVDNVAVGQTPDSGTLLVEGMQSGNHHLQVSRAGFHDWSGTVACDGQPKEVVVELKVNSSASNTAIPMPALDETLAPLTAVSFPHIVASQQLDFDKTVQQNFQPSRFDVSVATLPPTKKSGVPAMLLGIGGLLALLVIGIVGIGGAYMSGLIGGGGATPTPTPALAGSPTPVVGQPVVAEQVPIPAGTFMMGRDDGRENERPANQVSVSPFKMDKTEITNAEYFSFVSETGHRPTPAHWVNDKPIKGEDKMPVRFVNLEDISAFVRWRSKRDGVTYRLPTEAEWEFAARNGAKDNRYPWGNTFQSKCAVTDKETTEPEAVGTASCPNDWGIVDLIGNVYEWTGSKASLYPGSKGKMREFKEPRFMIRGGGALNKSEGENGITSTFRADVDGTSRDKELGFRLVIGN